MRCLRDLLLLRAHDFLPESTFTSRFEYNSLTILSMSKTIAGVSVRSLAAEFPTPFFVYDAESIRKRTAELKCFDTVRYAQKANSNLAILDLLRKEGVLVDCVSANEILRAFAVGCTKLVYTADIFDRESLDYVVEKSVPINCGSLDMIAQYGKRADAKIREITVRINPGFGHGHSRKTNTGGDQSKHGIWFGQIGKCKALADQYGLKITGLHTHIGSGCDFEHLTQVCGKMKEFALEFGPQLEMISTGGGLPIPYKPEEESIDVSRYFDHWDQTRKALEKSFGHPVRLETEPGRYLVAESGYLVSEIRAIKTQGENTFYLVDAGFNNLARPTLYGAYHPISIASANGNESTEELDVIVGGPLCESGDIFTQEDGGYVVRRRLPKANVGDYLILEIAGAYGAVMGSNYNSKPLAAEILIDAGTAKLIRRRQTFEQMIANEIW